MKVHIKNLICSRCKTVIITGTENVWYRPPSIQLVNCYLVNRIGIHLLKHPLILLATIFRFKLVLG
jgi:hypothetical protein